MFLIRMSNKPTVQHSEHFSEVFLGKHNEWNIPFHQIYVNSWAGRRARTRIFVHVNIVAVLEFPPGSIKYLSSYLSIFFLRPQVMINNGFTPDKEDYEFCTKVDNMIIPSEGFFGISAATGGLAGIILISVLKSLKGALRSFGEEILIRRERSSSTVFLTAKQTKYQTLFVFMTE